MSQNIDEIIDGLEKDTVKEKDINKLDHKKKYKLARKIIRYIGEKLEDLLKGRKKITEKKITSKLASMKKILELIEHKLINKRWRKMDNKFDYPQTLIGKIRELMLSAIERDISLLEGLIKNIRMLYRNIITKFDNFGARLFPGRKYVADLKLKYGDVEIPDLFSSKFRALYKHFKNKFEPSANNLVFADLGFVMLSPKNPNSGEFVSVPIVDKKYKIKWSEGKRKDQDHSEIALRDFLKDNDNLKSIIEKLSKKVDGVKTYRLVGALVIDIGSTNEVCGFCERELSFLQKDDSKESFLFKMKKFLRERGYEIDDDFKIILRVRAKQEFSVTDWAVNNAIGTKAFAEKYGFEKDFHRGTICETHTIDIKNFEEGVMIHRIAGTEKNFTPGFEKKKAEKMVKKASNSNDKHEGKKLAARTCFVPNTNNSSSQQKWDKNEKNEKGFPNQIKISK